MSGRYRRPTTPEEKARADEARTAKLEALHTRLAEQVAALRTGEDWTRWLATAARFHDYSFGNTMLILAQRPEATAVAGYEAWKALGRQVDKGEKGIAILAPVVRRAAVDPDDHAPRPGQPEPDAPGQNASSAARRVTGFRAAYVWDVGQTNGAPLPQEPAPQLLQGQAPDGLWEALTGAVTAAGYTVERGPCGGANGVTIPATRTVRVRDDVDDSQAVKTLAHELGHVLLHTDAETHGELPAALPCRGVVEVEAESVAYLVSAVQGLDSGAYTFPYVAHWAGGVAGRVAEDVVRTTGERVFSAARKILAAKARPEPESAEQLEELAERTATAQTATAALRARAQDMQRRESAINAGDQRPPSRTGGRATTGGVRSSPPRREPTRSSDEVTRAELLEVHRLAQAFYRERLATAWVPEYLTGRSLSAALDDPWSAGYAPAAWHALTDRLRESGLYDAVLLASGLAAVNRNGRLIDRFRDRLMLPMRDPTGAVVGFIGRAHPEADPERVPRYVNSPQTPIYRKSELLYGLAEARPALARGARPTIVEGPLDAIAVSSGTDGRCAGLAACGTALTAAHVDALAAAVDLRESGLVVAMDADDAGLASARSALELFSPRRISPTAALLPAGNDPASVLHDQGPAALTASLLDRAEHLADRVVDAEIAAAAPRLDWLEGRLHTARELAPLVASLPLDDIGRQAARIAQRLDLSIGVVQREIVPFIGLERPPPTRSVGMTRGAARRGTGTGPARAPAPPRPHTSNSRRGR
ncbi:MAG: toprim domain-containing protein [Actinobacteria bacterium]|nr:toprim domain-containing protein [Actinomycetota bacterium]